MTISRYRPNVLISALRSSQGASYCLLSEGGVNKRFGIHVPVPLVLEYQEVAKRQARTLGLSVRDIDDIIDYMCSVAAHHDVFYLWRPFLRDASDDVLLELAVEAQCSHIVTFNLSHFREINTFGIQPVTPFDLLKLIGAFP